MRSTLALLAFLLFPGIVVAEDTVIIVPQGEDYSRYVPTCRSSDKCTVLNYQDSNILLHQLEELATRGNDAPVVVIFNSKKEEEEIAPSVNNILSTTARAKPVWFIMPTWTLRAAPGKEKLDLQNLMNGSTVSAGLLLPHHRHFFVERVPVRAIIFAARVVVSRDLDSGSV